MPMRVMIGVEMLAKTSYFICKTLCINKIVVKGHVENVSSWEKHDVSRFDHAVTSVAASQDLLREDPIS